MGHSRFSPSATEREYSCPASFLLNEGKRDDSSVDADHGTAAHHIGEMCLLHNHDMDLYAGCRLAVNRRGDTRFVSEPHPLLDDEREFEVDDEMVENVQKYVDWCRELPGEHHIEVRVEHTDWCPDVDENGDPLDPQYGTSDHNACIAAGEPMYDEATLVITDLKYGRGVKVYASENKQAIKYALGVWKEYDWIYGFKRVVIRICQPRLNHFDVWELSVDELLEWGQKIKKRLELVFVDDPPFGPSEKACVFCKNTVCKARDELIFAERALMFDSFDGEPITPLNDIDLDELFAAYNMLPMLEMRAKAIQREVFRQLYQGNAVGDRVLVETLTHRTWAKDPDVIEGEFQRLGVPSYKLYKRELLSPAKLEKMLPKTVTEEDKKRIADLWDRPRGQPTVASPSDKRARYEGVSLDDFDEYEGE